MVLIYLDDRSRGSGVSCRSCVVCLVSLRTKARQRRGRKRGALDGRRGLSASFGGGRYACLSKIREKNVVIYRKIYL